MRSALILMVLCARAMAGDPVFTQGPDRAFNCTHYLDGAFLKAAQVEPGDPMSLHLPVDKVMTFKLAAKPASAKFSLEHAPPGATLTNGKFSWKVAGKAGQKYEFALVATVGDASTRWPITVEIASDELFTAWSAGFGSVWPDCSKVPRSYVVKDLDDDGRVDVTYRHQDGTHVMLQRGAKLKFVEAFTCGEHCDPDVYLTEDGTHVFAFAETACCCRGSFYLESVGDSGVATETEIPQTCGGPEVTVNKNGKGRITSITVTDAVTTPDGKVRTLPWDKATKTFHE